MILKQLIDNCNPKAYWTGESYTTGNVFDEYLNWTLVNTNATLGVQGGASPSLSSRAININGGYLRLSDATFANDLLTVRNISIGFGFRVYNRDKGSPIAGFKPIISKWNPEQSFMIGFENGIIVAKVQTAGGLVELEFDYPDIIYNDRWNYVFLNIDANNMTLWVNGCPVTVANTAAIVTTETSFFQIGGDSTEIFGEDVYVADITVCENVTDEMAQMIYMMPRTPHECVLNLNPTHYFNLLDAPNVDAAHVNMGSAGGYGYLTYTGTAPSRIKASIYTDEDTVNMPEGCKFAVDTMPSVDLTAGFSMLVRGEVSIAGMSSTTDPSHEMLIMDMRNNLSDNNGRFLVSYNYRTSGYSEYFGWAGYDATGTEVTTSPSYTDDANNHFAFGTKIFNFEAGDGIFETTRYYETNGVDEQTKAINHSLPLAINHFDIWSNVAIDNAQMSYVAIFDYALPYGASAVVDAPKMKYIHNHILTKYSSDLVWLLPAIGGNFGESIGAGFDGPLDTTSGYAFAEGLYDPNHNRQNDFPRSIRIPTLTDYIGGSVSDDNIDFNSNGMTIYGFIWNRNYQDRYRWIYSTSDIDLEIWMNSRDGVFSYGDVEVMYDKDVSDSHLSTTGRQLIDNGFHLFAVTRDGNNLSIWIDGEVVASKILASVPTLDVSNTTLRMHGGPLYINDWGAFMTPFDATDMAMILYGFQDYISGQCTLNGVELPSVLLATDSHTGDVLKTYSTDGDGNFKAFLPKSLDGRTVTVLALAQDDNATNNVVAHGPYNLQTDYRKYSFEDVTVVDYDDMVLDMEPYAYYKTDETAGATVSDSSGNSLDSTISGTYNLNQSGPNSDLKSIELTGVDGLISLPAGYGDLSDGFTFEAWLNFNTDNSARIFEFATGNGIDSVGALTNGSGAYRFFIKNSGGTIITDEITPDGVFSISSWNHVVFRISSGGDVSIWVNGTKQLESLSQSTPAIVANRTVSRIGYNSNTIGLNTYIDAFVSNISTYNHVLSDEEIERHSARGFEIPVQTMKSLIIHDNPFAYWTFDRLDQYANQTDEPVTLTQNGSFTIVKNALGINTGVVGNNYLTTDDVAIDDNGNGWTVEFSFKTGSTQVLAILLAEWDTAGGNVGTFKAQLNNSNLLSVHLNDDATQMVSTTTYNDDEWHHVVISNDGAGTTSLYVDGAVEDTISTAITYGTNDFSIGNSADGDASTATEAATYLDDVAIYKYGLNATRITEHYNQFVKKKVYQ